MAEYASKGVAGAALGTGIAGLSLGVLNGMGSLCGCNGGGLLGGLFGGNGNNCCVSRYELGMAQEIAAKDSRIGLLESQVYVDQKLVETVKDYTAQINDLAAEVRANKDAQTAINMQQAVYNGTNTATLSCIQQQIECLKGVTKIVVPNTAVCPGWGNVTITPSTTGATA